MNTLTRSLSLATIILGLAATGASAQSPTPSHNNPNHSGGATGSWIAMPEYPPGTNDPALSPGRLAAGTTGVPADEDPNVAGATGNTIVRGDNSTIAGARQGTIEQKTGADTASDAPGG
jgi:hypothetical protein